MVDEITLYFTRYPDYYWKKVHGEPGVEFDQRLQADELQDYSRAYLATLDDVVKHFTRVFGREPGIQRRDGVFSAPHPSFAVQACVHEEKQVRLSVMTCVDDTIWNDVKNTMKIDLRRCCAWP